jgi:hypothetical protein
LLKDGKGVLHNIQSYWIFNKRRFHVILSRVYYGPRWALEGSNLPLTLWSKEAAMTDPLRKRDFAAELGALGYPGFSYLKHKQKMRLNPAEVLLDALNESDLDTRVAEGLPWLALTYVDMDWDWLVRNAKLRDRQNRLGFAVSLACELAECKKDSERAQELRQCLELMERARLTSEDTFCHDSITQAERAWLRDHRSPAAAHWNLLTDMKRQDLPYASQ